jgi:RND superfamily putative drug exporter
VVMDTFVVRTILVPAIVVLLGRRNWWPSKLWSEGEPTVTPPPAVAPPAPAPPLQTTSAR